MLELKLVEHKEAGSGDNRSERDTYAIGEYMVVYDTDTEDGFTFRTISVIAAPVPGNDGRYLPQIYYRNRHANPHFEIETTSYGSLTKAEFLKFMAAQQEALEVVDILTEKFLNK